MFSRLFLSLLSLIIGILVAELLSANFLPGETLDFQLNKSPACFAKSDLLPFELKKDTTCYYKQDEFQHSVKINKLGFRGEEFNLKKSSGTFRILTVGDSFTFGHGASDNQTYSAVLSRLMTDDGKKVEVVNGGYASGFSPDSYFLFLKEKGMDLEPDLVIMGFFIWNDITDLAETQWEMVDEAGLPTKIRSRLRTVDKESHLTFVKPKRRYSIPILSNSHFFQLVYSYKQSTFDKLLTLFDKNPNFDPEKEALSIYDICIFVDECFSKYESGWQKVQKVLAATNQMFGQNNIRFLVVLVPARQQIEQAPCCEWQKLEESEKLSVNKKLRNFFENSGIGYLDLSEDFRGKDADSLYFKNDAHWTPHGHELVAEAIKNYIDKNIIF